MIPQPVYEVVATAAKAVAVTLAGLLLATIVWRVLTDRE